MREKITPIMNMFVTSKIKKTMHKAKVRASAKRHFLLHPDVSGSRMWKRNTQSSRIEHLGSALSRGENARKAFDDRCYVGTRKIVQKRALILNLKYELLRERVMVFSSCLIKAKR